MRTSLILILLLIDNTLLGSHLSIQLFCFCWGSNLVCVLGKSPTTELSRWPQRYSQPSPAWPGNRTVLLQLSKCSWYRHVSWCLPLQSFFIQKQTHKCVFPFPLFHLRYASVLLVVSNPWVLEGFPRPLATGCYSKVTWTSGITSNTHFILTTLEAEEYKIKLVQIFSILQRTDFRFDDKAFSLCSLVLESIEVSLGVRHWKMKEAWGARL